MRIPTVHMNGTGAEALVEQVIEAAHAVDHAIDKLRDAWPNGRDYYVQGDSALREAQAEWQARTDKLIGVKKELEQIMLGIDKQDSTPIDKLCT